VESSVWKRLGTCRKTDYRMKWLPPPGVNPTAANKYTSNISEALALFDHCAAYVGSCVKTFRNNISVPSPKVK
jgi:hypothetical protein